MSRSAKDIVTNEVKLGLGAQNTNIRRNTVLHRLDKLGIGLVLFTSRLEPSPDLGSSQLGSWTRGLEGSSRVET